MYLLDTNVVSELRRPRPHPAAVKWMEATDHRTLFLAAVTIGEIQAGIEKAHERDEARATELQEWVDSILRNSNILPMDGETFRLWARLMHRKQDHLYEDAMIAATALQNDLAVATQNTRDFTQFGVRTFDPFAG